MQEKIVVMGIFIICAQAVIHFSPGNVYAKYLRLLLSMMVLIQVLQPILTVCLGKSSNLQNFSSGIEELLSGEWSDQWKTIAGCEEQIDAIWEQEIDDYARQYMTELEEIAETRDAGMVQEEVTDVTEVESVVIRIEAMEQIRIGE